jgi:hypothetical protein
MCSDLLGSFHATKSLDCSIFHMLAFFMKMTFITLSVLIFLSGIVLLTVATRRFGKPNRNIDISFDELKNMELRNRK